jgi:hypothetical protein
LFRREVYTPGLRPYNDPMRAPSCFPRNATTLSCGRQPMRIPHFATVRDWENALADRSPSLFPRTLASLRSAPLPTTFPRTNLSTSVHSPSVLLVSEHRPIFHGVPVPITAQLRPALHASPSSLPRTGLLFLSIILICRSFIRPIRFLVFFSLKVSIIY